MPSIGRNERCPCGSGKKYKVCCLDKDRQEISPAPDPEVTPAAAMRTRIFDDLAEFASRSHRRVLKEARELFSRPDDFEDDDGYPYPFDQEGEIEWMAQMFSAAFFDLSASSRDETIAEIYLKRMSSRLHEDEKAWLTQMVNTRLTPYEILEVEPGTGFRARNLWTDEEIRVRERSGSAGLNVWDILAARITHEDGDRVLDGGLYQFSADERSMIEAAMLEYRRAVGSSGSAQLSPHELRLFSVAVHQVWIDLTLETRDLMDELTPEGDPIEFTEVLFDIHDEKAVQRALRRHGDVALEAPSVYVWYEPDGEGDVRILGRILIDGALLTLSARSKARAERCTPLLLALVRGGLTVRPDDQAPSCVVEEAPGFEEAGVEDGFLGEVLPEDLPEFMEKHYRGWMDRPLPRLEGETPREAVQTSAGRVEVVNLLKGMENNQSARGLPPYDFRWMWKELRLSRP